MRTIAYCISIVIGYEVEYNFLIEEFLCVIEVSKQKHTFALYVFCLVLMLCYWLKVRKKIKIIKKSR